MPKSLSRYDTNPVSRNDILRAISEARDNNAATLVKYVSDWKEQHHGHEPHIDSMCKQILRMKSRTYNKHEEIPGILNILYKRSKEG